MEDGSKQTIIIPFASHTLSVVEQVEREACIVTDFWGEEVPFLHFGVYVCLVGRLFPAPGSAIHTIVKRFTGLGFHL